MRKKHKIWAVILGLIVLVVFVGVLAGQNSTTSFTSDITNNQSNTQQEENTGDKQGSQSSDGRQSPNNQNPTQPKTQYKTCPECGGTKIVTYDGPPESCPTCKGAKTIKTWVPGLGRDVEVPCSTCSATGHHHVKIQEPCPTCR
ncbi:MAG: hypothetical protein HZC47_03240 [Methanobacterium sp.]|uniref:hypothetical protein n=1 Tax=Methanobacterium sp. TaxID=2164 RepID=UPI003D66276D|nr:hypothetical protein [Methanobacterium sp.]